MSEQRDRHHHHGHCHNRNHTQVNGEYWSSAAETVFNNEWVVNCQKKTLEHIQENLNWFNVNEGSKAGKMMDYACGEGYISRYFTKYFTKCIGIDVAPGMIEKFNDTARSEGMSKSQIYAVEGNLTEAVETPSIAAEEFFNFDLIITSMALHHVVDPQELIKRLVGRLSPGGIVVVFDWEKKDGSFNIKEELDHPAAHTIAHSGFTKAEMEQLFSEAECKDSDYTTLKEPLRVPESWGGLKVAFFAKGRK